MLSESRVELIRAAVLVDRIADASFNCDTLSKAAKLILDVVHQKQEQDVKFANRTIERIKAGELSEDKAALLEAYIRELLAAVLQERELEEKLLIGKNIVISFKEA